MFSRPSLLRASRGIGVADLCFVLGAFGTLGVHGFRDFPCSVLDFGISLLGLIMQDWRNLGGGWIGLSCQGLLGGSWDLVTTHNWAYNPTYNPPNWT